MQLTSDIRAPRAFRCLARALIGVQSVPPRVPGRHVQRWLNGRIVLVYERESEALKAAIAASKFNGKDFYAVKLPRRILLQNHGAEVWFRKVESESGLERHERH